MNRLFSMFVIFIMIILPSIGFCDISIVDNIEDQLFLTDTTIVLDNNHALYARQAGESVRPNNPARPSDNKVINDEDEEDIVLNTHANAHQQAHQNSHSNIVRPSTNKTQPANKPQQQHVNRPQQHNNNYRPSPPAHYNHYNHYEYTYRRPAHPHTEIVVVEKSPTYYESTSYSTSSTVSTKDYIGAKFGFGIRIIGNKVSDYHFLNGEIESTGTSPGFGWYIKYRPIRWISLEIVNDFIFTENNLGDNYVRIPLYFGIHTHLFDYGQLDLYAITNIGVSFIQLYEHGYYDDSQYFQWGGQFGLGISVLLSVIEIGIDVRYMLESAPADHYCYHDYHDYDKSKLSHGVLFSFNIGFGI